MPDGGHVATITVTFGTHTQTTPWTDVRRVTWTELADQLTRHQIGAKEGTCFVPATFRGGERKKAHAQQIDIAVLDSDSGATMDEIHTALTARRYRAIITSTHSHRTTRTRVKRSHWEKFLAAADDPVAAAEQFLSNEKGYRHGVAKGAHIVAADHDHIVFEHQPCSKFRIVVPLARPWLAANYTTQEQANAVWKERITALAEDLGLNHDQACTDTSRLFYLPRRPANGPSPETAILDGEPCDIFELPVSKEQRQRDGTCRGRTGSRSSSDELIFRAADGTELDLRDWARDYASRFEVVTALTARRPNIFVGLVTDTHKHHIRCPNEDAHTQAGEDHATFCMNASTSENKGGFVIHCRHAHCDGRDRLLFLRQMLEQGWLRVEDLTNAEFQRQSETSSPMRDDTKRAFQSLVIGSDAEIAERIAEDLVALHHHVVHDEGAFWRYGDARWQMIPFQDLWQAAFKYDGARFRSPKGEPSSVKLGKGRVESVLACMAALLHQDNFFAGAAVGINCASGFIRFGADGTPSLAPHNPDHRQRHVLRGKWPRIFTRKEVRHSLLRRLLRGCFRDDPEGYLKTKLLAEVAGVAALGCATRIVKPQAVILVGRMAENGKSQLLALMRGLLPAEAVSNISPNKFSDPTFLCKLAGRLLNAPDELASSDAIASEIFKQVITGDPVMARDVYRPAFTFQPQAQHVYATNVLPSFKGGIDRGVRRRLALVPLNRVIPRQERVERIGQRIGEEEPDLVLEWAVRGAQRVLARQSLRIPPAAAGALLDWIYSSDAVLAWLESDQVEFTENQSVPETLVSVAHRKFMHWAREQGFDDDRLPYVNTFSQRVEASGKSITKRRLSDGNRFVGLSCKGPDPGGSRGSRW